MIEEIIEIANDASGNTYKALLRKPSNIQPGKKYPVFMFLHGQGEATNNLAAIYNNIDAGGPANIIERGLWPASLDDMFVVAPQAAGTNWSATPDNVYYMIKDLIAKYPIDPKQWALSGLSAGGASTLQYIANESPSGKTYDIMPAVAIIMSHAAGTISLDTAKKIVARGVKVWVFIGMNDKTVSYDANKLLADRINQVASGAALFTTDNSAHNKWNVHYDPAWKDPKSGLSIYEWFLKNAMGGVLSEPTPVPTPVREVLRVITVYKNGDVEFK